VLTGIVSCAWSAGRMLGPTHLFSRLCFVWLGLISCQAFLGALTVLKNKPADIATAHVVFGALSLVLGSLLTLVCFAWPKKPVIGPNLIYNPHISASQAHCSSAPELSS